MNLILHTLHSVVQIFSQMKIELPLSVNNIAFNLLNDDFFTIPYITDTITNSPSGRQLPTQDKGNVCIIRSNE